jgi:fluoroquinolone resistance protein
MPDQIHENKTFKKIIQTEVKIQGKEFDECCFVDCDFSNSHFLNCRFTSCEFEGCNMSMVKFNGTGLNDVTFKDCKLLGINFSDCEDFMFSVAFEKCVLDYCSFMGKKMVKTRFSNSSMKNMVFTDANLTQAVFDRADLAGTLFSQTLLKEADFTTAINYAIDPALNLVKKAKFSLYGLPGLLTRYDIKVQE